VTKKISSNETSTFDVKNWNDSIESTSSLLEAFITKEVKRELNAIEKLVL